MRILHSVESLSLEAGGLPVAVTGLAGALAAHGPDVECAVVTRAQSPRSEGEVPVPGGVRVHRGWSSFLKQTVGDPAPDTLVHQHGLWARLPVGSARIARQAGAPLVISPHGMLEPWAMRHHSWKKKLAWLAYQRGNLGSAAALHATGEAEAASFRNLGLVQPIAVIPLGITPIPPAPLDPGSVAAPKPLRQALFLSRLHPKKGLDLLLAAWADLKAPGWQLIISGSDEGGHRSSMEALARRLGVTESVRFAGLAHGPAKDTLFRRADLFVLPSHSENFGFAVAEALQYGVPVITTTGTPWRRLGKLGCGWCVEPESGAIREALQEAISLTDAGRRAMGEKGARWIVTEHRGSDIAARCLAFYRWLADAGEPPDCVLAR